jgi:hypothetical protein
MSRSRSLHRKSFKGAFDPSQPNDQGQEDKPANCLAPDDARGQDSIDWRVTDDWPEQVPITSEEIEAIEAFLREAIEALLR